MKGQHKLSPKKSGTFMTDPGLCGLYGKDKEITFPVSVASLPFSVIQRKILPLFKVRAGVKVPFRVRFRVWLRVM